MDSGHLLRALRFAPIGIALIDPEECYLYASGAYAKRLDLSSDAMVGMPVRDCMAAEHYERQIGPRLRACLNGEFVSYQIEHSIDDVDRVLSVRYIPCFDSSEEVWSVLNIGVDVTSDCRPVEISSDTLHNTYFRKPVLKESTYLDTEDIKAKLEYDERLSSVGRALAMQNHELRNPLSTLGASLKLLQNHLPDTPEVNRILSRSERAMHRCESAISSLLDYSKPFPLHPQHLDLNDWASRIISDFRVPSSIALKWQPQGSSAASLDGELMCRALTNLLDNAVRELLQQPERKPREICIKSWQAVDRVCLQITDTGSGFPAGLKDESAPKTQNIDHHNTGFGLLIARQIVERHGGQLVLENNTGGGALAEIQLPRLLAHSNQLSL